LGCFTENKNEILQVVGSAGVGKTTLGEALAEYASQYTLEM
jgi:ABC-type dipeptide/oligopeptide/nickel transport system ATPase subunit